MLTRQQFDRAQRLALDLAGIELHERHRELLGSRSRRAGVPGHDELEALLAAVELGEPAARQRFISLLTTKFTGFFRNPWHFDVAAEHALWAVHRRGHARVWSAGAATGEEPYSLAMTLIEVFRRDDPPVEIFASDVDADSLIAAEKGEYKPGALRTISVERRKRFFVEADAEGSAVLAPVVRRLVRLAPLNLAAEEWTVAGPFDVIFCRNVLMYLEAARRLEVLRRLAALLAPRGLLILDPAEHLGPASRWFAPGANGVFRKWNT